MTNMRFHDGKVTQRRSLVHVISSNDYITEKWDIVA